jgi:hypothetical protein
VHFSGRLAWCGHEVVAAVDGLPSETSTAAACDVSGEAKLVLAHVNPL